MNKLIFSIIMIAIILIIVLLLSRKYKLNRNQKIIFCLLVLFWTSICIIREYRKIYATTGIEMGGLGLSAMIAAQIASAYGLISFLIRMPLFFLTDIFKNRKIFIQSALLFSIITSVLLIIKPGINSLYFSSLAMGVCASMLAIFNVMFSETFKKEDAAVSASILSVAPLLSEFIAAPIQYIGTYTNYKNFSVLWVVSAIIAVATLILSFFMVEIKTNTKFTKNKVIEVLSNKKFLVVCFVGIVISFIKFATSVNNMVHYSNEYLNMPPLLLAYLGPAFSLPQLIASVLVGTYFKNKLGIEKTLVLSLLSMTLFNLVMLLTNNYMLVFICYTLNGFGYGGTYISLISMAMQYFEKDKRNISMGIFQGFFAFGIFFGDRIYVVLSKRLIDMPKTIFIIVFSICVISVILILLSTYYRKLRNKG